MRFDEQQILHTIEVHDEHARLEFRGDLDINRLCDYILDIQALFELLKQPYPREQNSHKRAL